MLNPSVYKGSVWSQPVLSLLTGRCYARAVHAVQREDVWESGERVWVQDMFLQGVWLGPGLSPASRQLFMECSRAAWCGAWWRGAVPGWVPGAVSGSAGSGPSRVWHRSGYIFPPPWRCQAASSTALWVSVSTRVPYSAGDGGYFRVNFTLQE